MQNQSAISSPPTRPLGLLTPDVLFLSVAIAALNIHLISGGSPASMVFDTQAFLQGQWWRLLTFSFVHVSWYHLLLDAGAFIFLYMNLDRLRAGERLLCVASCGVVSFLAALAVATDFSNFDLCGLSGIAHGLMAFGGLQMATQGGLGSPKFKSNEQGRDRTVGLISFSIVASKSIYEAIAGDVLFSFLQFGLCGAPVAATHAGGVLGGIVFFLVLRGIGQAK